MSEDQGKILNCISHSIYIIHSYYFILIKDNVGKLFQMTSRLSDKAHNMCITIYQ